MINMREVHEIRHRNFFRIIHIRHRNEMNSLRTQSENSSTPKNVDGSEYPYCFFAQLIQQHTYGQNRSQISVVVGCGLHFSLVVLEALGKVKDHKG